MADTVNVRNMRLVNPQGVHLASGAFELNARPGELAGKRLGLLENSKSNSDKVLHQLGEIFKEKHGLKDVVYLSKHSASLPTKPEVIQQMLDGVDLLVTGIGD
ncbi:MAG: hypothetical protein QF714_12470 [Dehalococcoidia bacterium]|jgi:hypothetical protein|nr:hypothetical protein [Dehalococcoidia bacterium]MDP6228495.1 hypothetical protein [Dehalococcoidia bacterium]MDP7200738.1 hypothetical protein [Dehalococcoidia bacterium]MDP7510307.1 hypothetical protein [Dehalococcoidia bacterium]HJN85957.1 hypothetical protein [Dehalococcoidia bacterium]